MEVTPAGTHGRSDALWMDELVLETLVLSLDSARELAGIARVCMPLKAAASDIAARKLRALLSRLQTALPPCSPERASPVTTLRRWEALAASNLLWFQADERALSLQPGKQGQALVRGVADLSGRKHNATAAADKAPPQFNPCAINGNGAIEFSGSSVLRTLPFSTPLPQPITVMVVARARGDTTIVDSLGTR